MHSFAAAWTTVHFILRAQQWQLISKVPYFNKLHVAYSVCQWHTRGIPWRGIRCIYRCGILCVPQHWPRWARIINTTTGLHKHHVPARDLHHLHTPSSWVEKHSHSHVCFIPAVIGEVKTEDVCFMLLVYIECHSTWHTWYATARGIHGMPQHVAYSVCHNSWHTCERNICRVRQSTRMDWVRVHNFCNNASTWFELFNSDFIWQLHQERWQTDFLRIPDF